MENIETLLAAVAQTQGFDDDESVASTGSAPRLGNFGSSPEIRGDVGSQRGGAPRVVPGDIGPYVVVRQPPLDQMTGTSIRRKRGRPPKVQPSAKPPPPKRRKEQKEGQLPAKPSPPKRRAEQEKEGQLPAMPPPPKRIEEQGKEGQLPVKPLPPKRREEQVKEGQLPAKPRPPKRRKEQAPNEEDEEEDYCFICLDGGSLVLCDRKGCPKVYHPSCVKRDEAFFTSKAKWTCGWHICSVCRKASYYMCYTCPYSLCKGCSKDADFLHVRGNKGFCNTCMKIITLIENKDQASNDSSVQVDFDDTTSWEYLFKTYWVILKEKLSLTMDELTRVIKSWRGVAPVDYKPQLSNVRHTAVDGKTTIPNRSSEHLETTNLQELHNDRLTTAQSADAENGPMINRDSKNETTNGPVINADPGSNKQAIEKAVDIPSINDTADPGTIEKPRGGPAEMPNLDSRLLVEDDSQNNSLATAGVVGSIESNMEVDGNNFDHLMGIKSRKQEKCKHEEREIQSNLNKYAAVDVHNMNLIYLRRNLMENLIDDKNFQDKVVGSIVRIRISSDDQKPDVYRLVQVVRICKVAKPYKIGDKMVDVMLEVLNLGKKEVVSVDAISNQEFTEAECRQLDQYVRCGLLKQYIFDEVQKKAMALQSVRFNDWLEAEALRLYHLLDQASKKGCEDEVSEYVRKIQLLKSPDECQRRISEVPEIHEDVEMAPIHISEDVMSGGNNTKGMSTMRREDIHASLRRSGSPLNGEDPVSPNEKGNEEGPIHAQSRKMENIDARGLHGLEQHIAQVEVSNSAIGGRNNQEMVRSELETSSAAVSIAIPIPEDNIETEKLWHYRDSNGKIQGPFSMMHLRLLSTTRQFPPEMRIWTNHEQYDSLLLTDALNGKLHGASELPNNLSSNVMDGNNTDGKQTHGDSGGSTWANEASWTKCWDLFKDKSPSANEINHVAKSTETNSSGPAQFVTAHHSLPSQSFEEKLIPLPIRLSLNDIEPGYDPEPVSRLPESSKQEVDIDLSNLPSSRLWGSPSTEKHQSESSNVPVQTSGFLELLSPKPRSDNEDEESRAADTKQYGPISSPVLNSGPSWWSQLNMMQFPDNEPIHPGVMGDNVVASDNNQFAHVSSPHPASSVPSWMATIHEPIEFVALGEDSISDLLAEVDAMESRRTLSSPTSAAKFIKELFEDSKDDCFSSIEDFIPTSDPVKSDALSSTGEIQLSREPSVPCKPVERSLIDALNSYSNSGVQSSGSSTGETSAPVYSGEAGSEFHGAPPSTGQDMVAAPNMGTMALGPETSDPGWGSVQGNINLVTVQGNVNLVLGGPAQGMANLGWGANQGTTWGNPSMNHSPKSGSFLWDSQRKYSGERFAGGREWGYQGGETVFGRGRLPWGRLPYGGGGGYSRPLPKGQRVCKFYESGHCKKGAYCDYLHP